MPFRSFRAGPQVAGRLLANGPGTLEALALERLLRGARRQRGAFGGRATGKAETPGSKEFSRIVAALHKSTYDTLAPYYQDHQRGPYYVTLFLEAGLAYLTRRGIPRGRMLDWGCGGGTDSWFAASLGHDVVGIDISPGMIEKAHLRGSAEAEGNAPTFRTADLLDPDFGPDEDLFDLALAGAVVHNLPPADAVAAVQKILSLLRPGGIAIFSTTSEKEPGAGIEAKDGRSDLRRFRIKFTRDDFVGFIEGCGFEISHVREFPDPNPRDRSSRRWLHVVARRPGSDEERPVSDGRELARWIRAQHRAPTATALWHDDDLGQIIAFGEEGWHADETPDMEFSLHAREESIGLVG